LSRQIVTYIANQALTEDQPVTYDGTDPSQRRHFLAFLLIRLRHPPSLKLWRRVGRNSGGIRNFNNRPEKKPGFRNQCKFFSIKAKGGHRCALKNVLTTKTGLFGGRLAEKRGGRVLKTPFFFVFFRVLGIFSPGRR
jgi:hypothetical protein